MSTLLLAPLRRSFRSSCPYCFARPFLKSASQAKLVPRSNLRKISQRFSKLNKAFQQDRIQSPTGPPHSRTFSSSSRIAHGHLTPPKPGDELHVTFIDKEGDEHTFDVSAGDNLLDIAQDNELDMEGACGGSCACSTCHIIVDDQDLYDRVPEPDDDENDMLDLAFGLTETSRLGCQVKMGPELEGLRVKLPRMTRNLQQSDFSKKT